MQYIATNPSFASLLSSHLCSQVHSPCFVLKIVHIHILPFYRDTILHVSCCGLVGQPRLVREVKLLGLYKNNYTNGLEIARRIH
jgi:hypothetical protein